MSEELQPRPTEYKGVRFRSKSEAVFARCLDLSDKPCNWMYEPSEGDNFPARFIHPWDFFLDFRVQDEHGQDDQKFMWMFAEYKPSRPSDTYLAELQAKVNKWLRENHRAKILELVDRDCLVEMRDFNGIERVGTGRFDLLSANESSLREYLKKHQAEIEQEVLSWCGKYCELFLVWGSPWNPASSETYELIGLTTSFSEFDRTQQIERSDLTTYSCETILGITPEIAQQAKAYRFDLQQ